MRYWSVLTVVLEKIPGKNLVEKLRAILLMEADFNFGYRLLFGSCMVKDMDNKHVLPQDIFGSRKELSSVKVAVCRALFFDVVRQRKVNADLGSYDAQS